MVSNQKSTDVTTIPDPITKYIDAFTNPVRGHLLQIHHIVREEVPEATESISYGMPAWKLNGKPLVYMAGYRHHVGFYATPSGHEAFQEELAAYKQGKGSVQFPLDQPLPVDLIRRMVRFRAEENRNQG
ncbi:MAG: DUF1801 domain-containing protein [Lewinellaceae bacterium]|nr:DUF1801 domain-containing protein [Lewinellaceae bacterium]